VRWKGKPFAALATIMLGQGILPFYAGWAAARGELAGALNPTPLLAALSATLIIGGMYPLTQIYQLDADAERGDLTAARFLGVENSFRLAFACIGFGGAGAVIIAGVEFSLLEAGILAVFILALLAAIARWRARFYTQTVMQNFKTLMRLYAAVTLPFLAWIFFHLALDTFT
jgi:1,4-dihydroxy-2-naphthoate octaprenyltransferase